MERKLKPTISRRPKERIGIDAIVRDVHEETGFSKKDIKEVYRAIMKAWFNRLLKGQSIIVPILGTMMPWLRPPGKKHALFGGRKDPKMIEAPAKWMLKFVASKGTKEKFGSKKVTKEQVDNLYKD